MSVLTANLKHLYQRRLLWLAYLLLLLVALFLTGLGSRFPLWIGLAVVGFLGAVLGGCQGDVLSRPLCLLLPHHATTVRWQALVQSAVVGFLLPLLWLPLDWNWHPLGSLAMVWLLGVACCLIGTTAALALALPPPQPLPWLIVGGSWTMVAFLLKYPMALDQAVLKHPGLAGGIAVAGVAGAWLILGRRDLARRWYQLRYGRKPDARPSGNARFSQFCADQIQRNPPHSLRHYLYGALHDRIAVFLPGPRVVLGMLGAAVLVLGYSARSSTAVGFPFQIMLIMGSSLGYLSLGNLRPWGRRQRCSAEVVGLVVVTAFVTAAMGLAALLTRVAAPVMPGLHLGFLHLAFHPFPPRFVLIPVIMIPLAWTVRTWLGRCATVSRKMVQGGVLLLALLPPMTLGMALQEEPTEALLVLWLALPAVAWLLALGALRYHCLRRDLV